MSISNSPTPLVPVSGVVGVYLNKRTGEPLQVPIVAFSPDSGQTFYVDRNGKVVDYRLSREDDVWSVGVFAAADTEASTTRWWRNWSRPGSPTTRFPTCAATSAAGL